MNKISRGARRADTANKTPCGRAPGYRNYGTGALNGIGYDGYSWSSTVSGTNGMRLHFHMTWLAPSYADNRGYGFQLRCLSE